ncbi:MAG TPA: preprotein translocase subunit SecG [Flavobacteriales bacterium]|mgnify:CR=1 FL=1|nr:preprotein translocase subunit SecG [Flavobacteriales bacterium]HNU55416.1 preprotein translocase subunit SecG [Flavobacteriales bacterium]
MVAISILIVIVAALLALVVLAQNPKGGGLAAGFTGAQQIGGVQRTADFLEKGTWTLAGALMVLCLISAGIQHSGTSDLDELDTPTVEATPTEEGGVPAEEVPAEQAPATDGQ